MKAIIKLLFVAFILVLIGCQDNDAEMEPENPETARYVYVSFNVPYMSSNNDVTAKNMHNYITHGYTVNFTGEISEEFEIVTNVNMNEPLKIEVSGDVVISVVHPDYDKSGISKKAFFSVEEVPLATEIQDELTVDLNFTQGYVLVNTEEDFDFNKYSLTINDIAAEFNTTYYLTDQILISKISYLGMSVEIGNTNIIGDGYVHYAFEDEEGNLNFM